MMMQAVSLLGQRSLFGRSTGPGSHYVRSHVESGQLASNDDCTMNLGAVASNSATTYQAEEMNEFVCVLLRVYGCSSRVS
jgi:hypothetical protein